jgi:hypothetical protein
MAEPVLTTVRRPIRTVLDESPYKFKCRDFAEIIGKLARGNIRNGISGMGGVGRVGALDRAAGAGSVGGVRRREADSSFPILPGETGLI